MKKIMSLILSAALIFSISACGTTEEAAVTTETTEAQVEEIKTSPLGEMRGITAKELIGEMGAGWNLGNTMDAIGGETAWGNPVTTKAMIDEVKKAGFNTIRIPTTWYENIGEAPDYNDLIHNPVKNPLTAALPGPRPENL